MELLEQYEELVERSPSEISYVWKGAAIVAYFLSSLSAYACSILFSIFWAEICGGHCYLWSDIRHYKDLNDTTSSADNLENFEYDWIKDISVTRQSNFHCNGFHFACLSSCAVSLIMLVMFLICGKGGYDTTLFIAPWRLVLPALVSSLIMTTVTMTAASSFTRGYFHFSDKLYQIVKHAKAPFKYNRSCRVFQQFTQSHNVANYDPCMIYWMIQMCLWTMIWSWIGSFCILLVRILMSVDFNLLKVKIYALPSPGPQRDGILKMISEGKNSLTVTQLQNNHLESPKRKRGRRDKVL